MLRLLGTDLDGPDTARELFVSVNTVRTTQEQHLSKLGVTYRRVAVRRSEELDLMSRHRDRRSGRAVFYWQDTGPPSGSLSGGGFGLLTAFRSVPDHHTDHHTW